MESIKQGDWICSFCGDVQFAKKTTCRKCGRPKTVEGAPKAVPADAPLGFDIKPGTEPSTTLGDKAPPRKKSRWDEEAQPPPMPLRHEGPPGGWPQLPPGMMLVDGVVVKFEAVKKKNEIVKELNVPMSDKAALIGKGGEVINRIRKESGAAILISGDDPKAPSATVEIKGSLEDVERAEAMIKLKLEERNMPGGTKWGVRLIDVPKEYIGETIGHGGCNLQQIAKAADCRIAFLKAVEFDEKADPGKQVCCIRGLPAQMEIGEQLVLRKVEEVRLSHEAKARKAKEEADALQSFGPAGTWNPSVPCKFHSRRPGSCRNGDGCYYSHDAKVIAAAQNDGSASAPGDTMASSWNQTPCRYWSGPNTCMYGSGCAYAHGPEEPCVRQATSSTGPTANADGSHQGHNGATFGDFRGPSMDHGVGLAAGPRHLSPQAAASSPTYEKALPGSVAKATSMGVPPPPPPPPPAPRTKLPCKGKIIGRGKVVMLLPRRSTPSH